MLNNDGLKARPKVVHSSLRKFTAGRDRIPVDRRLHEAVAYRGLDAPCVASCRGVLPHPGRSLDFMGRRTQGDAINLYCNNNILVLCKILLQGLGKRVATNSKTRCHVGLFLGIWQVFVGWWLVGVRRELDVGFEFRFWELSSVSKLLLSRYVRHEDGSNGGIC